MCDRRDPSGKEGIDEVQWAALEKQNRKKNQENHKVEKWFEIWDVLFPGANRPKTPCKVFVGFQCIRLDVLTCD